MLMLMIFISQILTQKNSMISMIDFFKSGKIFFAVIQGEFQTLGFNTRFGLPHLLYSLTLPSGFDVC